MRKGKVLVTGGCGFIGREVVRKLLQVGYSVVVADNFSNSTPMDESATLKLVKLDLTKSAGLSKIFDGVDYCIHLAARVGGVKYMSSNQSEILRDNILIDSNIISSVSHKNIKIVYASTVIVYDQSKDGPFTEDQIILSPKSNYGFSKLVGERLCQVFGKDNNLKYSIARICNVYGINPNMIPEQRLHVIPDLIRKILVDKNLKLIAGGQQIRTFAHISDIANALILMMESEDANGEIFNVATDDRYQILELAKMIWELLKKKPFYFENTKFSGEDFIDSSSDGSKLSQLLGWKAKETLRKRLPEIVEWYGREYGAKAF